MNRETVLIHCCILAIQALHRAGLKREAKELVDELVAVGIKLQMLDGFVLEQTKNSKADESKNHA